MSTHENERLDRLEQHFRLYKEDLKDLNKNVDEMRILLGGSALNGNKGFLRLLDIVEEKMDAIEKQTAANTKDISHVKFYGRGSAGVLFAVIVGVLMFLITNTKRL